MAQRYAIHETETKWRHYWEQTHSHRVDLDRAENPFYNLMEFPYPSGEGLHVGHVYTYCGADAFGRLRKMQGYDVFQPMGFDAFGIHSENYAIKIGQHPVDVVPVNTQRFREEQLKRLGCQFDWSREVDTTKPEYYRWTQWIFLQLFKAGLAYQAEASVNWCPRDQTVLANEQVVDGRCERCSTLIEQRLMRQWFFRITQYADRLLDFNGVDFPEASIKRQTAWIGRSEGAEIDFAIADFNATIRVFTTRADTIAGATAIVLAPEHPLVQRIASEQQRAAVDQYIAETGRKLERERLIGAEKTGVWSGAYAINPINGEHVQVWIADYVLPHYGTGAVMCVPAHDERDDEFATRYNLPIKQVIVPADSGQTTHQPYTDDGILISSNSFDGMTSSGARQAIIGWLEQRGMGQAHVTYRLHDWLISRQRYWGPPIPIVYCDGCGVVPVPEDQLPVLLPYVEDFRPTGVAPLAAVPEFVNTSCPKCGGAARRETDVSDNFLDSAWYFLRYTSTDEHERPWNPARIRRWLPVDQYAGGPEHTTMHHLYARFITKALHDLGHLPFDEPFKRLRLHGMITKDGAKMSKSRGNVITPDGYIESYGADVFRMYMLFLGPWEDGGDFTDAGIGGIARFVGRTWDVINTVVEPKSPDYQIATEAERRKHRLVARVQDGLETLRFHVAIAALMEEVGWLRENVQQIAAEQRQHLFETVALLIAPLAPHFAEELWAKLGHNASIHQQAWPSYSNEAMAMAMVELPVQINGKVRDRIIVAANADDNSVQALALASPRIQADLGGIAPRRVVVVAGRVVNIVR